MIGLFLIVSNPFKEGGGGLKFAGKDNRDAQNIRCIQE